MNRRDFIKSALWGAAFLGGGLHLREILAAPPFPTHEKTVFVNLLLEGGPDFRHLFVPPFDSNKQSYGYQYWSARATSHALELKDEAFEKRWQEYLRVERDGVVFGIHPTAAWLKEAFEAGKVAIVNNVLHSNTRDHAHSLLVLQSGDYATSPHEVSRSGWGGRLAKAAQGNVLSMTPHITMFCNGPHPTNALGHDNSVVLSAATTRPFALAYPDRLKTEPAYMGDDAVMARALRSYYEAKRQELDANSPYARFLTHEKALREFGDAISKRLDNIAIPEPIKALYGSDAATAMANKRFGEELRNLYDSFACADLVNLRIASLIYGGWDSHKWQKDSIEPKFKDIFGKDRGLDTFMRELKTTMPEAQERVVFAISGEFGRQLSSNGDRGTDHGRGNTVLLIGEKVKGGIYGEMFPQSEIPRFQQPGEDIEGRTSFERVFGEICEWIQTGTADTVFPKRKDSAAEQGVPFEQLFKK